MPKINLSSKGAIHKLKATGKQYVVWDEKETGFGIRVGEKIIEGLGRPNLTWFIMALPPGAKTKRRITIGRYGEQWTPTKARHKAAEWKTQIRNGADPAAKQKLAAETPTVIDAFEVWLEHRPRQPILPTIAKYRRYIKNLGQLERRRLDQIDRYDIAKAFRLITAWRGPAAANKSIKLLNALYIFFADDYQLTNPVADWLKKGGKKHTEERKKLHPEGVSFVLPRWRKAFDDVVTDPLVMDALLWGFYSGIRVGEIIRLKFSDFELERGSYKITVNKNDIEGGKEWSLPLNHQLADILARRFDKRVDGNPYLFPSKTSEGTHVLGHVIRDHTGNLYTNISNAAGVEFWMHTMRNAFLTVASRGLYLPDSMVKQLVGHEPGKGDVTEGYKNAWTLGQLRTVSQKVADRIDDHVAGRVEEDEIDGDFALNDPRLQQMQQLMAA